MRSLRYVLLGLGCCFAASSCFGGGDKGNQGGTGGQGECRTGFEGCGCYGNRTCEAGLTCASSICVALPGGSGGTTAVPGTGGAPVVPGSGGAPVVAGSGGAPVIPGSGGAPVVVGSGGAPVVVGSGGAPVVVGSGGAPAGCTCSGGQECTTDTMRCVNPNVIDDFSDCDPNIVKVHGRSGAWYAAADRGINSSFAVSVPPSGYSDRRCGAWTTGGPIGSGTTNFGLLGVSFVANSVPYDLRGYTGITIDLEAQSVDFTVKTANGGYFVTRLATTAGSQSFTVDFFTLTPRSDSAVSTLDLSRVTDIQFTVIDPSMGYGFVIHGLTLYR